MLSKILFLIHVFRATKKERTAFIEGANLLWEVYKSYIPDRVISTEEKARLMKRFERAVDALRGVK